MNMSRFRQEYSALDTRYSFLMANTRYRGLTVCNMLTDRRSVYPCGWTRTQLSSLPGPFRHLDSSMHNHKS